MYITDAQLIERLAQTRESNNNFDAEKLDPTITEINKQAYDTIFIILRNKFTAADIILWEFGSAIQFKLAINLFDQEENPENEEFKNEYDRIINFITNTNKLLKTDYTAISAEQVEPYTNKTTDDITFTKTSLW